MINQRDTSSDRGTYARETPYLLTYTYVYGSTGSEYSKRQRERKEHLTGIKVARDCPSISHLLFGDVVFFFFCKAKTEEYQTILMILKEYKVVSGQLINFEKN